ncbi:MAG: hypothetical protein NTY20_05500 [Candidatus Aenigmarchaeota archaeon]|nr:hypothetical protein [Candidatus Aenigmarchaeota archaeon]
MLGIFGNRKGMASLMLWLIIAIVITAAVIVIIWFITGKLMGWNIPLGGGGTFGGGGASGGYGG